MKLKYFSSYLALGVLAFTMGACNDAEYSEIENGVYIAEAGPMDSFNQQFETQLVDDGDLERTFTVRLVRATNQDVKVTLEFDQSMIDAYNEKHGTDYQLLPDAFMTLSGTEAVIPAGKVNAPSLLLTIKPYTAPNNESYAIPVKIASVTGPVSVVGNGYKLLLLLTSPNKQKSVVLNRANATTVHFKAPIPTTEWTFEYWIKVNNKTGRPTEPWAGTAAGDPQRPKRALIFGDNSAPIHMDGSESFLLRYWADGVKKTAPTLQCQLNGPFFDSTEFWYPDTWYHIAYTYDGAEMILYKDGVKDNSLKVAKKFDFGQISFCSSFGWQMEVEFAQIRLWNKCLPAGNIQDGMSRMLPGDTDGLVGYWPCNEESGNVLKDHSKNGNDITFNGNPGWSADKYNFAHPND